MKKSLQLSLGLGLVASSMLFSGCASATAPFSEFKTPKNNEAVLYVYRPSKFVASGMDYKLTNKATNEDLGELENGTFFEKSLQPGKMVIYGKYNFLKDNEIEVDLEPNKVTCVKSYIGGFIQNVQFEKVDMDTCKKEIIDTKKILD